ncbi:hypothetical protein X740_27830 [Mesorhizobium sp. LNHC221B00]|nr:hypothetical protein X740_27830 [Mesorhizobium sp. LNHC221B00]
MRVGRPQSVAVLAFQDLIAASQNPEQPKETQEPGVMRSG